MICLDSDCIIDFLKGKNEAVEIVNQYKDEIVTTEINRFEIFFGVYIRKEISEKEENAAKSFFDSIEVLSFEENCGERAARFLASLSKKGNIIDQNDVLIGSVMINNGCKKIITRNEKHFSRMEEITVIAY